MHLYNKTTRKGTVTTSCCSATPFSYLLCDKNFPVACPDPSHPGMGHLVSREGDVSKKRRKFIVLIILNLWEGKAVLRKSKSNYNFKE
jgi:hypothetical protein